MATNISPELIVIFSLVLIVSITAWLQFSVEVNAGVSFPDKIMVSRLLKVSVHEISPLAFHFCC